MLRSVSKSADDLEPLLPEAGIVGEREAEVAGAEDRDPDGAIEAEDHPQVALELLDVVADAAHAELAEVGEVFPDLRGVELKLLGQRLGRDGFDARGVERVQAPQVDGQTTGSELRNLIAGWARLVPSRHKLGILTKRRRGSVAGLTNDRSRDHD